MRMTCNISSRHSFPSLWEPKNTCDDTKKVEVPTVAHTRFQKVVEVGTKIPRVAFAIFFDFLLLPGAAVLLLTAACKLDFNPTEKDVKKDKIPILMLHGSGFNETEWIVGRQFLNKKEYGSVFSLNYDGLISNDPRKGIDDYAKGKIREEIKRIKMLTGQDRIILMGHSMGGLIAGYYAEHCADADNIKVEHVISIASPWQGTPIIDYKWKWKGKTAKENETKRHQQMSVSGGTFDEPEFRQNLVQKALESERQGVRKYYNIWSTTDYAVPCDSGCLTKENKRQRSFTYLGHYGIVIWPSVWLQVRSWLDDC